MVNKIHPTAIVDSKALLGNNVEIGPYAVIGPNVRIGDNTIIKPHVVIEGWTNIGKNCTIFQFASIGAIPQDLKYAGEKTCVDIGDNTIIRESVTINLGTSGGISETKIGNGCLLMACVHIAHDCYIGNGTIIANNVGLAGHVRVEDKVVIGGLTGIHQFVKVGRNSMIAAMSRVVHDVPPYILVAGYPAMAKGLNTVGIQRMGINKDARRILKQAYNILYNCNEKLSNAILRIEQDLDNCPELENFLRFLRSVERGICRPKRDSLQAE